MVQTNHHLSFKYVEFALKRNHFCNWRCSSNWTIETIELVFKPVLLKQFLFLITLGYLYDAFDIREIVVQKNSDNAGGKPTRGFSLQHETFTALNYAQDFGATVRESLKRTTNSKWATLTKSHHSQLSLPSLQTWSCDEGLDRELSTFLTTNYKKRIKSR